MSTIEKMKLLLSQEKMEKMKIEKIDMGELISKDGEVNGTALCREQHIRDA